MNKVIKSKFILNTLHQPFLKRTKYNGEEEQKLEEENLFYQKYNAVFKLSNRSVVSVTGEDAENFLQSMITNDIKILKNDKVAMAALFLNPKGRILFDSIVVKSHFSDQKYPDYWLDIHEEVKEELMEHLSSHCLRKKVQIQDLSGFLSVHSAICLYVGPENNQREEGMIWKELQSTAEYSPSDDHPDILVTDSMSFNDPRLKAIGCRIICPTDSLEIEKETVNYKLTFDDYDIIRMLYGIPEGPSEVKGALPLNLNFQHLNFINFNKGCYIGQELTQRTYHRGVIRKMAMPFVCTEKLKFKIGDEEKDNFQGHVIIPFQSVTKSFSKNLKDKEILDANGEVVGRVINSIFNCGVAMIDREKLESSTSMKFNIDGLNTIIYDPISMWDSIKPEKESKSVPKKSEKESEPDTEEK